MSLIELSDYTLTPTGTGQGLSNIYFSLSTGDICAIESQNADDAHQFIRALATLIQPAKGTYHFNGKKINFTKMQETLNCKRKIGYIASDAALISNLTIRQNLLLMQYYFSNDLSIEIDEKTRELCQAFGIDSKLHQRPAELNTREAQAVIVVREYIKKPEVLLLTNPEEFIGHEKLELLTQIFNDWIATGKPVVLNSYDRRLVRLYANRTIIIANGSLTTIDLK